MPLYRQNFLATLPIEHQFHKDISGTFTSKLALNLNDYVAQASKLRKKNYV